jgi:DNA-binding transcriptional LysR family regulator
MRTKAAVKLDDMATFAAVVREGSFTGAARAFGITKQSISERIARLEDELGVQLLVRSTRSLRLTEIGEQYHRACAGIVAQAETANVIAQQAQHHPSGVLRVTCPVGLSRPLVMPTIEEYRRIHPAVTFEVLVEERVVDLIEEGLDLAIRVGSTSSSPTYMSRPLFDGDAVYVASHAYLERHGEPKTPSELGAHTCVLRRGDTIWKIQGEDVPVGGAVVTNTVFGVADAVLAGLGIGALPELVVRDEVAAGQLRVLFGAPARRMRFFAMWPSRRLSLKVRSFLDLLACHAREL